MLSNNRSPRILPLLVIGFLSTLGIVGSQAEDQPDIERPSPDSAKAEQNANNKTLATTTRFRCCRAGSRIKDDKALGGFGPSDNFPKSIQTAAAKFRSNVYLLAEPEIVTSLTGNEAMRLVLVNSSDQTVSFAAADSVLEIIQEARVDGEWRPIEKAVRRFCGNSYHRVFLPADHYWSFSVPRYDGPMKTQLRFRLNQGDKVLYSNEFAGGIDPRQIVPLTPEEKARKRMEEFMKHLESSAADK